MKKLRFFGSVNEGKSLWTSHNFFQIQCRGEERATEVYDPWVPEDAMAAVLIVRSIVKEFKTFSHTRTFKIFKWKWNVNYFAFRVYTMGLKEQRRQKENLVKTL